MEYTLTYCDNLKAALLELSRTNGNLVPLISVLRIENTKLKEENMRLSKDQKTKKQDDLDSMEGSSLPIRSKRRT